MRNRPAQSTYMHNRSPRATNLSASGGPSEPRKVDQRLRITRTSGGVIALVMLACIGSLLADHTLIRTFAEFQSQMQDYRIPINGAAVGSMLVILMLAGACVIFSRGSKLALAFDLAIPAFCAFMISQFLHVLFPVERPFQSLGVLPLLPHSPDPAFPSDHAVVGFAVSMSVWMRWRIVGIISLSIATMSSVARVISLLHWPSDVVNGATLGCIIAFSVPALQRQIKSWLGPSSWRSLFEDDKKFSLSLVALRSGVVFVLLFAFLSKEDSIFMVHSMRGFTPAYPSAIMLGLWGAFLVFIFGTNRTLLSIKGQLKDATSRRESGHVSIWPIVVFEYFFYSAFYVLGGRFDSSIFYLFVLPLVTVALLNDVVAAIKVLTMGGIALGISILVLYQFEGARDQIPVNWSSKQWLALGVFAPRGFLLCLCCIPIAWLVEKHATLEQARARYESLVEQIPQLIIRKNLDGTISYANNAFCKANNLPREKIIGSTDEDLYGKEVAERHRTSDAKVIETKEIVSITQRHKFCGQEQTRDIEGSKIPVCNTTGKVVEIQLIFWDVTLRKQREAQLEALMNYTRDHIYFKDRASCFLQISNAQAERFNLESPAAAIGKTDKDFFAPEHAQAALKDEEEIMRTGEPKVEFEEQETWFDGKTSWVSTTKQCLRDSDGNLIGTFGISRDITHRKNQQLMLDQVNKQLREQGEKLKQANSRLDMQLDRASRIAHFGFWEWDIYADGDFKVKATDEVYRIFRLAPQQDGVSLSQMQRLVHLDDLHIWNENFSIATLPKPFSACEIRLQFDDGTIKHLYARSEYGSTDEDGLPLSIVGIVQDITDRKQDEFRTQGLELAIRGFRHMIPGKADETSSSLECATFPDSCKNDIEKALCFIFMIRHKADEVRSLFREKHWFQFYKLGITLDKAWVIALDLITSRRSDLTIIYGDGTDADMKVNGAVFTAAVNILSNARLHGTPPFLVWTFRNQDGFNIVFGDGGPRTAPVVRHGRVEDRGVGLALVHRILGIVQGRMDRYNSAEIREHFVNAPEELKVCHTFFYVLIPMPDNSSLETI